MRPQQTYIIFTASDTVYCTAGSYDLANEIIEADGLVDAVVQQVDHITNIKEGNPVTISYENTSTYDCTTDNVNDVRHKDHY